MERKECSETLDSNVASRVRIEFLNVNPKLVIFVQVGSRDGLLYRGHTNVAAACTTPFMNHHRALRFDVMSSTQCNCGKDASSTS